jgi:DNA-binding response OmpR family regulator
MMPGLDGFEVTSATQWQTGYSTYSGVDVGRRRMRSDTVVRCIQLGAEDFLPKPFNTIYLMARIESSLSRKRLTRSGKKHFQTSPGRQDKSDRLLLNIPSRTGR